MCLLLSDHKDTPQPCQTQAAWDQDAARASSRRQSPGLGERALPVSHFYSGPKSHKKAWEGAGRASPVVPEQ